MNLENMLQKNLILLEKFLISLSKEDENVLLISSCNVIVKPENNSLNLSNSDIGISDKFFKSKDLSSKIAFKINPKLNSIFYHLLKIQMNMMVYYLIFLIIFLSNFSMHTKKVLYCLI